MKKITIEITDEHFDLLTQGAIENLTSRPKLLSDLVKLFLNSDSDIFAGWQLSLDEKKEKDNDNVST